MDAKGKIILEKIPMLQNSNTPKTSTFLVV